MNLSLIGYRGCGKSMIAPLVAQALGWDSCDSDRLIEERAGKSIAEIFTSEGEPAFRQLEREVLKSLSEQDNLVIATGGGAVLAEETRQRLRESGIVIWLTASPEVIVERLSQDATTVSSRPSLTNLDWEAEIRTLLQQRLAIYESAAHELVSTEGRTPEQIAAEVVDLVHRQKESLTDE